jgi:hypothetical protein
MFGSHRLCQADDYIVPPDGEAIMHRSWRTCEYWRSLFRIPVCRVMRCGKTSCEVVAFGSHNAILDGVVSRRPECGT